MNLREFRPSVQCQISSLLLPSQQRPSRGISFSKVRTKFPTRPRPQSETPCPPASPEPRLSPLAMIRNQTQHIIFLSRNLLFRNINIALPISFLRKCELFVSSSSQYNKMTNVIYRSIKINGE